ncbi:multidrug MFS transporter [Arenicella chitinivorans]|uniref:Multidrug MFS transporter n=1 Tax=Arenicella chitinivorans TaxID=1329800 RepID=A0A918RI56_9GAMM|nr:exopolysaccharide biosynthesis polyprenyl glycosylphosphotransferase [Arenicella chitinivorans]GGZ99827.1 multidrug MFS transporter [Arenicella chitinivorans]
MRAYQVKSSWKLRVKSRVWKLKFKSHMLMKRSLDVLVAGLALCLLSPLLLLVGVAIKLESKGPVFFKQQRVGVNGTGFTMFKFRSMVVDAEARRTAIEHANEMQNGVLFKMKRDPRITRVGALIRKASIDELPQLINVIKGDMSLVGPRPPLASEVAQYSRTDRVRLMVLPGITCIWQVCGRSDIPFEQQVELDLQYIESQSIWVDIMLLIKTIPAVLTARGAY